MSQVKNEIDSISKLTVTRQDLVDFRRSTPAQRANKLEDMRNILINLKEPQTTAEAAKNNQFLSNIATFIKFDQILNRMENQGYFEILIDWYNLLPTTPQWAELSKYFEMHPTQKSQMRLKCPIDKIPQVLWLLFEQAQLACKLKWFVPGGDATPEDQQLFPLPFQGLGKRANQATDKVAIAPDGLIEMSVDVVNDLMQLPAGGMLEDNDPIDQQIVEFIEEQCADLYKEKAIQDLYDAIPTDAIAEAFNKILFSKGRDGVVRLKVDLAGDGKDKPGYPELLQQLQDIIASKDTNSVRITNMVAAVEAEMAKHPGKEGASHQKYLRTLRADIQVLPSQKLQLWKDARNLLENHSTVLVEDQLLDGRAAGYSTQTSKIYLMTKQSFQTLFRAAGVMNFKPGDDLAGHRFQTFSYLGLIKDFRKIRFHHLEIANKAIAHSLLNNQITLDKVYNKNDFEASKNSLNSGINEALLFNDKAAILKECWNNWQHIPRHCGIYYKDMEEDLLNPDCSLDQFHNNLWVRRVLNGAQKNELSDITEEINLRVKLPTKKMYTNAMWLYQSNQGIIDIKDSQLNINIPALVHQNIQFDASNPIVTEARRSFVNQISSMAIRELFIHLGQEADYNQLFDAIQEKYLAESKKLLGTPANASKKVIAFKGLQNVLDLNPFIALTREVQAFGLFKSKDMDYKVLKTDLKKQLAKYSSSMFVAPHRKREVSDLKKRLKHLEKTAAGRKPTYMEVIQELHKQKLACMDDDIAINKKRHTNKLNRKGKSRLMNTLNKMEDLVVKQMLQAADVNQIDLYTDFTRDQFKDLALATRCMFEAKKGGAVKYVTVISKLKGIEDLKTPLTSVQVTDLMASLEKKKLSGYMNAIAKDLSKRSVALIQDLKQEESLNFTGGQ